MALISQKGERLHTIELDESNAVLVQEMKRQTNTETHGCSYTMTYGSKDC